MIEPMLKYWHTGGPLMPLLALISYGIWYYFLKLRRGVLGVTRVSPNFEDELLQNLNTRTLEQNLTDYERGQDPLSRAVSHVLRAVQGSRQADEAFDRFQQAHIERIGRDLLLLTALTAAAPLLGLLGTVIGMVSTFDAVADTFGNTSLQVSEGISQALITTQCGLVVGIPGLFGTARVRRLMDHARVRLGQCRIHLVFSLDGANRQVPQT